MQCKEDLPSELNGCAGNGAPKAVESGVTGWRELPLPQDAALLLHGVAAAAESWPASKP